MDKPLGVCGDTKDERGPVETVTREDIPHLKKAAAYCFERAAMAWGERDKAHWHRVALKNESLISEAPAPCRCGHPIHAAQCPNPSGCWCDTFTTQA